MTIDASVQHNGAGLLTGIMLLTQCYYHSLGNNLFKWHEEVLHSFAIGHLNVDIFYPDWGMLRRSRCLQIFL